MLPNSNAAAVDLPRRCSSANHPPAMINFTAGRPPSSRPARRRKVTTIVTSRGFIEKAKLEALDRETRQASRAGLSRGRRAKTVSALDKLRGLLRRPQADPSAPTRTNCAAILFTSGSEGAPKGVDALAPQHPGQCRAGRGAHRFRPRGPVVQRAAGVPFLRHDRRDCCCRWSRACRSISIPRRCITGSCRNWSTTRTPPSCSAPTPCWRATRAPPIPMTSARCAM